MLQPCAPTVLLKSDQESSFNMQLFYIPETHKDLKTPCEFLYILTSLQTVVISSRTVEGVKKPDG